MISRKSSAKSSLYDLRFSYKTNALFPILLFLALSFLFLSNNASTLYNNSLQREPVEFIYMFFDSYFYITNMFMYAIFIASAACGVMAFRFINSKKSTNVFLSLNLTRTKLILNRFTACITMLSAAIILAMLVNLLINIFFVDVSSQMIQAWLYLTAGMLVSSLAVFSITALAMFCAGGILEGILYTAIFVYAPTLIFSMVDLVCGALLNGFPSAGSVLGYYYSPHTFRGGQLLYKANVFNPLLFFDKAWSGSSEDNALSRFGTLIKGDKISIAFDSVLPILVWLALSACILFAAVKVFKLRKAENAGSFGKNRNARLFTASIVSSFSFCFALYALSASLITAFVAGLLIAIFAYFIFELIILRSFKDVISGLKKLPVVMAVIIIVAAIPVTGAFGYADRIPDVSEVEKVYLNSIVDDPLYFSNKSRDWNVCGPFESEADIATITSLHKTLKDAYSYSSLTSPGYDLRHYSSSGTYIRYELKNGKTLLRWYAISAENIEEASVKIGDSDFAKDYITTLLTVDDLVAGEKMNGQQNFYWGEKNTPEEEAESSKWSAINFSFRTGSLSSVYLMPSDLLSGNTVSLAESLSPDEYNELKKCILDDRLALGTKEYLFSDSAILGYLVQNYYGLVIDPESSDVEGSMHFDFYNIGILPISSNMEKTIAFLEEKNLTSHFEGVKKIVSAALFVRDEINYSEAAKYTYFWAGEEGDSFNFSGNMGGTEYVYTDNGPISQKLDWIEIYKNAGIKYYTDEETIASIVKNAKLKAIIEKDARIVQLIYDDGSYIYMYLPPDKVPA